MGRIPASAGALYLLIFLCTGFAADLLAFPADAALAVLHLLLLLGIHERGRTGGSPKTFRASLHLALPRGPVI